MTEKIHKTADYLPGGLNPIAHFPVMKLSVIQPSAPFCHSVFHISAAFLKPASDVRGAIVSLSKKNPSPIPWVWSKVAQVE